MLMEAIKTIPGSIHIVPGQRFIEPDAEKAAYWIKIGYAFDVTAVKVNKRGWDRLIWDDATVVILASGESLTQEQCDAVQVWRAEKPNRYAIVINTTFRRAPWADILYACDGRWWEAIDEKTGITYYEEARDAFKGQFWTQEKPTADKYDLKWVRSQRAPGLSKKSDIIHQGNSGGFQAINLAYNAGVSEIILLGYDCRGGHWHGNHPTKIHTVLPYKTWINEYRVLAVDLALAKVKVINCSPNTALPHFEKGRLDEVLAR